MKIQAILLLALVAFASAEVHRFVTDLSEEIPGTGSTATGSAWVTVDDVSGVVEWRVEHTVTACTAAHIHAPADPGQNAGVVLNFGACASPIQGTSNLASLHADFLLWLFRGQSYINIHSPTFPAGEIRGHLGFEGAECTADWQCHASLGNLNYARCGSDGHCTCRNGFWPMGPNWDCGCRAGWHIETPSSPWCLPPSQCFQDWVCGWPNRCDGAAPGAPGTCSQFITPPPTAPTTPPGCTADWMCHANWGSGGESFCNGSQQCQCRYGFSKAPGQPCTCDPGRFVSHGGPGGLPMCLAAPECTQQWECSVYNGGGTCQNFGTPVAGVGTCA